MRINTSKPQIVHVRNHQRPRSTFKVTCGSAELSYTESYKYILSNALTINMLTGAASRPFGRIHNMFKKLKNMGIQTYETLYKSYVLPMLNYACGVWGFDNYTKPQILLNRISRFFLGVFP